MKIGFTGTQKGMTDNQRVKLDDYVRYIRSMHTVSEYHHGDCIGADSHFHSYLVMLLRYDAYDLIYIHPPDNGTKRAWCYSRHIFAPKPYLERNHDIIDAVDLLIATPKEDKEVLRSGTWATIRYARKLNKQVYVIRPGG